MAQQEGYDVLRLIECGQICYVSSEYVRGKPLACWLKYHPNMTKEQLFSWITQMTKQLGMIHRCRKNPCYRYVNPYSIIVAEESGLYFLDMDAGSNERMLRLMRRKCIREHFLPEENPYYNESNVALDVYGLGKTIQYLLHVTEVCPGLTWREEHKIQKLISRCLNRHSKKAIQSISEIRRYLPDPVKTRSCVDSQDNFQKYTRILLGIIAAVGVGAGAYIGIRQIPQKPAEDKEKTGIQEETKAADPQEKIRERLNLALAYFLEVEDYEKAAAALEEIEQDSAIATRFRQVARALTEDNAARMRGVLPMYLEQMEETISRQRMEEGEELPYLLCLIRGYRILDSRKEADHLLRLGERCLEQSELQDWAVMDVRSGMARAYEWKEEPELAAEQYLRILELEESPERREDYYSKIIQLYEEGERMDAALDLCVQGIGELQESRELKILHLQILCRDARTDRGICAQIIKEYLQEDPGLENSDAFQKLKTEYGIRREGGEIWVGEKSSAS